MPAAAAPAPTNTLGSPEQVGASLYTSTREVLIVTPYLRSKVVADGLRRAAVERGAQVYILTDVGTVKESAGFLGGLSMVKGVQVRLLRGIQTTQATIDRRITLEGPLLADVPDPTQTLKTTASSKPQKINSASTWFTRAWKTATPYTYDIPAATRTPSKP